MADQKDAAAKARIISHMNADHAASLSLYLQHFCKLPASATRHASLTDITLSAMTIRTRAGRTESIPFNPPLSSFAETRARVVAMDHEARDALDISAIQIDRYIPPSSIHHVVIMAVCIATLSLFACISLGLVVPGTWFYDVVLPYFPGGPGMFLWVAQQARRFYIVMHTGESWWLDRSRLRKYGVEWGTALWWKWIGSCCLEGFGSIQRFDREVKRNSDEAAAKKH